MVVFTDGLRTRKGRWLALMVAARRDRWECGRALTSRRGFHAEFEHPGRALMATAPLTPPLHLLLSFSNCLNSLYSLSKVMTSDNQLPTRNNGIHNDSRPTVSVLFSSPHQYGLPKYPSVCLCMPSLQDASTNPPWFCRIHSTLMGRKFLHS